MTVEIVTSDHFRKEAKKLLKKYRSLKDELFKLIRELEHTPTLGQTLGNDCYKIRLAVKSKGKGKRGGLRVITFLMYEVEEINEETTIVNLVSIYDKSDFENLPKHFIAQLIQEIKDDAS